MSTNSYITTCPRCGTRAYEKLSTHAHCVECLYTEDSYFDLESAYHQALRIERTLESAKVVRLPRRSKVPAGAAS
jgi:predicted amidophosphoribosyltransferase